MICGIVLSSLDKLLKLPPEHIVHLQLPSALFGNVQAIGATRIEIRFLQDENVGMYTCEEIYDPLQLLATVDIPIDDGQQIANQRDAELAVMISGIATSLL